MNLLEVLPGTEPRIAKLLERHKKAASEVDWTYYDYLPIDAYYGGTSRNKPLSEAAYNAVEMAALTEANLPWYTAELYKGMAGSPAPLQEFVYVWTSEEDQHGTLLETYLLLTDNGDRQARYNARKQILRAGWKHNLDGPFEAMVYTAVQELATRAFYQCTAEYCEGEAPDLARALRRIAKDETLHMAFYRDVVKAHLEANPDYIESVSRVLLGFYMPGIMLPDYNERTEYLARAGIYGPEQFYSQVVQVLWSYWGLDQLLEKLSPEKRKGLRLERYRSALVKLIDRWNRQLGAKTSVGHGAT
jgi:acyl-[acyl-carrier-protein] desaturase